jgi:hypothetical protein
MIAHKPGIKHVFVYSNLYATYELVRWRILWTVNVKAVVLWDVTSRNLADRYQRVTDYSTVKIEVSCSF